MKKIPIFFNFLFIVVFVCSASLVFAQTEQKINIYYNSPNGGYDQLDVKELSFIETADDADPSGSDCGSEGQGRMMRSETTGDIYFCRDSNWGMIGSGAWTQVFDDSLGNYMDVFLLSDEGAGAETNPTRVGIATRDTDNLGVKLTIGSLDVDADGNVTVVNDGSFIARGEYVGGTCTPSDAVDCLEATGAGTRMIWYPHKAAFRAGGLVYGSDYWDDTNIGNYSAAFGRDVLASGEGSFATGKESKATGDFSTAMGDSVEASGYGSVAFGEHTIADSFGEVAAGSCNDSLAGESSSTWVGTDGLFTVGNGPLLYNRCEDAYGQDVRRNALVVLKNGMMGVWGTKSTQTRKPLAPLWVDVDDFIVEHSSAEIAFITRKDGDAEYNFDTYDGKFRIEYLANGFVKDQEDLPPLQVMGAGRYVGINQSAALGANKALDVAGDIYASSNVKSEGYIQMSPRDTLLASCENGQMTYWSVDQHFYFCSNSTWKMICYEGDSNPSCP